MQAPADAEQKLYSKRPQRAEFLEFPVIPDKADETVQRVEGDLVIDAKSIYDSMYGAWSSLAMEEKNSHRNDGDPGRNETNECDAFLEK